MTEHCVCAHCKLAAAEKEIERLRNMWVPYELLREAAEKLKRPTAAYQETIDNFSPDDAWHEKRGNVMVDLFFASQAVIQSIPKRFT